MIDKNILSDFVRITNDKKTVKEDPIVYGTVVVNNGSQYVKMDGAEILTPIETTTDIKQDERVMVSVRNHRAVVTGNLTNPSAGGDRVTAAEGAIGEFDYIIAGNITADNIQAGAITADKILAGAITADKITADAITANKIKADSIESKHIQADAIKAEHISAGTITGDLIQGGTITGDKIQAGSIIAGDGIIADGAIGNAQISNLDAGKIEAGKISTSKVEIIGEDGHLRIKGNRLQVFDGTGINAKERVSLGDVNGDKTKFGLRVRGSDGQTVILDENGVTSEGITDGSITNDKISENAEIDGAKLNINSVITSINDDGTEVIRGTKIEVDGTNLHTKLSVITNKQDEDGERITQNSSKIDANEKEIKLKVSEQIYQTDKDNINSQLSTNTSAIDILKENIKLKVEQTDIDKTIKPVSDKVNSAESNITNITNRVAEIDISLDGISTNVSNLDTTITQIGNNVDGISSELSTTKNQVSALDVKLDGITQKVSDIEIDTSTIHNQLDKNTTDITNTKNKVSSIETDLSGITSRVSNVETSQTEINGIITDLDTRVTSAESKITEESITNTVKKSFYTKSETDKEITSKGYQTESQVQQIADSLRVSFEESGGYNLLSNSAFKNGTNSWTMFRWDNDESISGNPWMDVRLAGDQWGLPNRNALSLSVSGLNANVGTWLGVGADSDVVIATAGNKFSFSCLLAGHRIDLASIQIMEFDNMNNRLYTHRLSTPVLNGNSDYGRDNWTNVHLPFTIQHNDTKCFKVRVFMNRWNDGSTNSAFLWIGEPLVTRGHDNVPYTPNADEVYSGITAMDKDGITVQQSNINGYTKMSADRFVLNKDGKDVFKMDREGLYVEGKFTLLGGATLGNGQGDKVNINNADYSIVNNNVTKAFFGLRALDDGRIIPRLAMGADGLSMDRNSYFVAQAYPANNNPQNYNKPYIDLAYRVQDYKAEGPNGDVSNFKMYGDGDIRISPVKNLEITTNFKNGSYGGSGERRVALFTTSGLDEIDTNLQVAALCNHSNGKGLILMDRAKDASWPGSGLPSNGGRWRTAVRVHTDGEGLKFFRPLTEEGDIANGSGGFPWKSVHSRTLFSSDGITARDVKTLDVVDNVLDGIEIIQNNTKNLATSDLILDVTNIIDTCYVDKTEDSEVYINQNEMIKLLIKEIKDLKAEVRLLKQ